MTDPKRRTVMITLGAIGAMTTLVAVSPQLYRTFCQVTGWGGTTQRADTAAGEVLDRTITIRFDATTAKGLPWRFTPAQGPQTLHVGETGLAYYEAANTADYPVIGTASYNVQPAKAGPYFMKVACFCFTEQLLQPHETVKMPVTFFVDPSIADDPSMDDVREITLSYIFYRNERAEEKMTQATAPSETAAVY